MTQVSGMTTIGRATSDIRKGRRVILREVQSNDFGWLYAISTASATGFRISKDDLVPTEYNLRESYRSFSEFEQVCSALTSSLNSRVHSVTKCVPNEALKTESETLHAIPDAPYTAAFGESRRVSWSATVSYRSARYSVPDYLADTQVWVRSTGTEVVIVAGKGTGATEVARHPLLGPGQASILEEHYPNHAGRDPLHRIPRPTRPSEEAFLAIGEGAKLYLVEACSSGVRRIEARMADAVTLTSLYGKEDVDSALNTAAMVGRFGSGDLESILAHGVEERNVLFPPKL